jgi:hypothetical protein
MSGGAFNYDDQRMVEVADELAQIIRDNKSTKKDSCGENIGKFEPDKVIEVCKVVETELRNLYQLVHELDWYLSRDTNEKDLITAFDTYKKTRAAHAELENHTKYLTATADLRKQLALHKLRSKNEKN